MEVYFTEKEKEVELAPQPQLDIFELMAQPMIAREAEVPVIQQKQEYERSAFDDHDGEMNASGSDSEKNPIKASLNQMQLHKVKAFSEEQEELKQSDYKSHVDDELLADIAKVSQNLKMNQNQQMQNYQDFNFQPASENHQQQLRPQNELIEIFEMFPETDHAIIEDLYAQCEHDKDALIEAVLQLQQESHREEQKQSAKKQQVNAGAEEEDDEVVARRLQEQEVALARREEAQHKRQLEAAMQESNRQQAIDAQKQQQVVLPSYLESGRDEVQMGHHQVQIKIEDPPQHKKKNFNLLDFFKSCMSSKRLEGDKDKRRPIPNPNLKKPKEKPTNQLSEEEI